MRAHSKCRMELNENCDPAPFEVLAPPPAPSLSLVGYSKMGKHPSAYTGRRKIKREIRKLHNAHILARQLVAGAAGGGAVHCKKG
jgi:hypothetical protein